MGSRVIFKLIGTAYVNFAGNRVYEPVEDMLREEHWLVDGKIKIKLFPAEKRHYKPEEFREEIQQELTLCV